MGAFLLTQPSKLLLVRHPIKHSTEILHQFFNILPS